jgi:vacuolar-type H+-ATPase subunit I/STV1
VLLLLAQATPDPVQLAGFLGCVAFLVGIAVGIKKLREKSPESPLRVKADEEFVTTTSHDKDIREIKEELKRHSGRRAEIYETQRAHGAALAALDEKTDLMNSQLVRQEGKIDRILERLPRQTS